MNIGSCVLWEQLLVLVQTNAILNLPGRVKRIYEMYNGQRAYLQDVYGFRDNTMHYIETTRSHHVRALDTCKSMAEFLSVLKTQAELNDEDIGIIANVFAKEQIQLKHLSLLKNEAFKEIGIVQVGLCTSILQGQRQSVMNRPNRLRSHLELLPCTYTRKYARH
jgi:hypothetical protein